VQTVEQIVSLYNSRRETQGPVLKRMREIRDLANGDVVIPLSELDRNARTNVANLLVQGLDQTSMRIASTMPTPFFPPMKQGNADSQEMARLRKKIILSYWDQNKMGVKMRRRARHFLAYSSAPVILKPNFKNLQPTWSVRNPLDTYPAPAEDPDNFVPEDCIFTYTKPAQWLINNYGDKVIGKLRMGKVRFDTKFTLLEYIDGEEIVVCAMGAENSASLTPIERAGIETVELERMPNRTGMPLTVIPQRISLDTPRGQYDGVLGMYFTRARLQALTEIAIERGIFPDEYLVARAGENPEIIQVADGKTGQLGVVKGGDIQQLQTNPGYKTDTALDRLERQERLEGAIPAEFGGESGSNIRTGRRGENVLSATVDFRVQEAQAVFEQALYEEDKIAIAIEKNYWGAQKKSFFIPGRVSGGMTNYVPNKVFETDFHYVTYPSSGTDVNGLIVGLGQRLGTGLMSKESARESDPLITDPELEKDRIAAESMEAALLSSIQAQAADPNGPYQPDDLAYLSMLTIEKNKPLYEAVQLTQKRAQERQAAAMPQGAPETMPGLAMPGMGAEAPAQGPSGPPNIQDLLSRLGGGQPAGASQLPPSPSAVLTLGRRL
jgi:hypothetical protein